MNKSLISSKYMEWETPQELYEKLNKEFNFTLDAAASDKNHKTKKYYTKEKNGLQQSWQTTGSVFCNPPYGRTLYKWIEKAHEEAKTGQKIVMLIPARTDTSYFHKYIYNKTEIRFIKGRIKFCINNEKTNNAPFPSMIVIWG